MTSLAGSGTLVWVAVGAHAVYLRSVGGLTVLAPVCLAKLLAFASLRLWMFLPHHRVSMYNQAHDAPFTGHRGELAC